LPVLVIWGRADLYVSASYAEQQRNYFPKVKVVMFDDSGHWPFADNPERAAAEIVPFIKACVAA
jgi:pimeloyl-ACP methyl ester carboxylesterase